MRARVRFRAATFGVLGVAAVLAAALAGCGGPGGGHSLIGDPTPIGNVPTIPTTVAPPSTVAPTTAAPTTTLRPTTTVTTAPAGQPPRPYAVGWTNLNLTDTSRTTGAAAGRHLPTLVFYPASGSNPATETPSAPGLFHSWPLVIFAEGYNTTPLIYHDLIHHLASSGFVVAAPSFPLETAGGTLNEADLSNEPQDIKFVISQLLGAGSAFGVLNGMIDPSRVALVGHSDGGEAVLGEAYDAGIADARVGPVVAMSASGVLSAGKVPPGPKHDLLVVQGTADTINPPAQATALYQAAPSPKAYLQLLGAGHLPPMVDPNQWRPVVEATIVDWLDAWLGGPYQASAAGRLGHDADVPGTSQIGLG